MPSDHSQIRLDHIHCRAICDEIGDRLREMMGRESADMPSYLRRLVDRLGELDDVPSPGIVPVMEDLPAAAIPETLETA